MRDAESIEFVRERVL